MADGSQIIIEVQRKFQNDFLLRLELYAIKAISKQFDRIDSRIKVHDRYGLPAPLYVLAIVKGKYFKDDIICRELNDGFPIPFREGKSPKKMIRIVLVEIDKYYLGNFKSDDEKSLYEFFLNKPYSSGNIPSILTATDDFLYETKDCTEEDIMDWIKEQEIRAEERAEAKAQLLEVARKVVKEFGLNPEAVAQQFGISSETL